MRVHTDGEAAELARNVGARAFTVGRHVVFGQGEYQPRALDGRRRIAHELAHAAQQRLADAPPDGSPLRVGHSSDPLESEARRAADAALRGEPAGLSHTKPLVQREDLVEVELETPTAERQEALRQQGIQLPRVSAAAADPKNRRDYIDRRMSGVGYNIYLGGFVIYCDGTDQPIFVPNSHFDFGAATMAPSDLAIHPTRAAAMATVPAGPWQPGQAQPYAYYEGAGGAGIAPTIFSPATTPRIIATALQAQRDYAVYVQDQMIVLAASIVGGAILRAIIRRITRPGGPRAPRPPARPPEDIARDLAARNGNSVRRSLPELNGMGLSQNQTADVLTGIYRASGRDVGNRVMLRDGRMVLTSATPGTQRPVNIISPRGQASFGHADIEVGGTLNEPFRVSNVRSE